MPITMREVEYTVADPQRFAGWMHIAEPNCQICNRLVGHDVERDACGTKDFDRCIEWHRLENHRTRVVCRLIIRLVRRATEGTPLAGMFANCLWRTYRPWRFECAFWAESFVSQKQ